MGGRSGLWYKRYCTVIDTLWCHSLISDDDDMVLNTFDVAIVRLRYDYMIVIATVGRKWGKMGRSFVLHYLFDGACFFFVCFTVIANGVC